MKKIDSQALGILTKSLGLTGAGSPITELMDGVVDQVLDIGPCVRRGRTQAGTEGIYSVALRCAHVGADSEFAIMDPYNALLAGVRAPYPSPMPAGFDIWLLAVGGTQGGGSSTVNVVLRVQFPGSQQGFGIVDSTAVVVDADMVVARFDAAVATTGSYFIAESGDAIIYPKMRLPRSLTIQLRMDSVSSGATTHTLNILLGVFPTALGQDVIG